MFSILSAIWSSELLWERLEYIAELIVLIGCVGEFLSDGEHLLKGEESESRRHSLNRLFALVLIGGLAIELGALARTNQLFDENISALTTEARDARSMADGSNSRAEIAFRQAKAALERADQATRDLKDEAAKRAKVEGEAAMLRKRAEDEALARVKIEERLAGRRVTPEQHDKFVFALKRYRGSTVTVTKLGDKEAGAFADDIIRAFMDAGWNVLTNLTGTLSPPLYGVHCSFDRTRDAGKALSNALVEAIPAVTIAISSLNGGTIADITVGLRLPP